MGSMTRMFFMAVRGPGCTAILSCECQEHQAEHVEGSQESGEDANEPIRPVSLVRPPRAFVFAEEARQPWDPSDCASCNQHGDPRPGDLLPQPSHFAHVLLATDSMDHRPSSEE